MKRNINRDLGSKAIAGTFAGFTLSVALCGLYGWLGPGSLVDKYMVVLWLLLPVWMAILTGCFFFTRGKHSWFVLIIANLIAYALLGSVRQILLP